MCVCTVQSILSKKKKGGLDDVTGYGRLWDRDDITDTTTIIN